MISIIPARGGSKGIPRKNIRLLGGKPLIAYTIEAALQAKSVNRVFVSTEDLEIAEIAKKCGAEIPFMRPKELATDVSSPTDVYIYTIKQLEKVLNKKIESFIALLPTSPLRIGRDIDRAVKIFLEKKADSVISVNEAPHPPSWFLKLNENGVLTNFFNKTMSMKNRQEEIKAYIPNGAIYVLKTGIIRNKKTYYTDKTYAYLLPPERSIDIDNPMDFALAEILIRKLEAK